MIKYIAKVFHQLRTFYYKGKYTPIFYKGDSSLQEELLTEWYKDKDDLSVEAANNLLDNRSKALEEDLVENNSIYHKKSEENGINHEK